MARHACRFPEPRRLIQKVIGPRASAAGEPMVAPHCLMVQVLRQIRYGGHWWRVRNTTIEDVCGARIASLRAPSVGLRPIVSPPHYVLGRHPRRGPPPPPNTPPTPTATTICMTPDCHRPHHDCEYDCPDYDLQVRTSQDRRQSTRGLTQAAQLVLTREFEEGMGRRRGDRVSP